MAAGDSANLLTDAIAATLRQKSAALANVKTLAHASVAVALLQSATAGAVTLGKLELNSALGEPFRASTTATISNGETLRSGCITTSPYRLGMLRLKAPLMISTPTTNNPGTYTIELATARPLHEPMYEVQLQIDCPGTAVVTRSYIVMLDAPAGSEKPTAPAAEPANPVPVLANKVASSTPPIVSDHAPRPARKPLQSPTADQSRTLAPQSKTGQSSNFARNGAQGKSVNPGQVYQVVKGDTLFGIAARLNERPAGTTWAAVDLLHKTNPEAFINGDRQLLKVGAKLTIPASEVVVALKPGMRFTQPATPSAPTPKQTLPARPALVRNEQSNGVAIAKTTATNDKASDDQSSSKASANPQPYADRIQAERPAAKAVKAPVAAVAIAPQQVSRTTNTPPQEARPNANNDAADRRISFPANESANPLLAGLLGMLIGALFATLVINGRRILSSLRAPEWSDSSASGTAITAFDTTDTFERYDVTLDDAHAQASDQHCGDDDTAAYSNSQVATASGVSISMSTDEIPAVNPEGTIEVHFSELDALEGKTLGFDLSEAIGGDTAEQPTLSESPRINLEGMGSNFDLQSELQEMLRDFNQSNAEIDVSFDVEDATDDYTADSGIGLATESDAAEYTETDNKYEMTQPEVSTNTIAPLTSDELEHTATDTDMDISEIATHPDIVRETGQETLRDLQTLSVEDDSAAAEDTASSTFNTLAIKPFSLGMGVDLDVDFSDDAGNSDGIDFSLDEETDAPGESNNN